MNKTLANLIRLQELLEQHEQGDDTEDLRKLTDRVRGKLTEAHLRRFEHFAQRGRSPVAQVSESGACGSCHLKLTPGDSLRFRRPQDPKEDRVFTCPFCGCFLYVASAITRKKEPTAAAP